MDATTDLDAGSKVVVILGAGFSHAVYPATPMTDDLGEAVRSRLDPADATKLPRGAFSDGRFEEWLSYISEPQPQFNPEELGDARTLALRVTRTIGEVLSEVQDAALAVDPPEWFWEFLSVLHVLKAQVLTLNYDNFIESGIHTFRMRSRDPLGATTVCEDDILAGLPPCADFPGLSVQSRANHTWAGNPVASGLIRQNTFKLLKLHGSLSWYWLPDSGGGSTLKRWRLPGMFGEVWDQGEEVRRQELPAHEVFIVPPAALKGQRLGEPVTKELWRRAANALAEADRVVLVGYSVPHADHSITGMVSDELAGRDVCIQVVNPRSSEVKSRLLRLGIPASQIEPFAGDDCIAQWTKKEVERMSAEVVNTLRSDETLTGEEILYIDGPRTGRFDTFRCENCDLGRVTLHANPEHQQLTNPLLYKDIKNALQDARACEVDIDGEALQVIDYWRQDAGGALMSQLHLVLARRSGRSEDVSQSPLSMLMTTEVLR